MALVADVALALKGESTWTNAILGAVAVDSFGLGRVVGRVGKGLAARAMAQGPSRGARVAGRAGRYGNPARRALARNAWDLAQAPLRTPAARWYNPASWARSSFGGLQGPSWFMSFAGHTDIARAYQTLRNADAIAPFARNATGYVDTLGKMHRLAAFSAVPYALDVAGNGTLLYRDSQTW